MKLELRRPTAPRQDAFDQARASLAWLFGNRDLRVIICVCTLGLLITLCLILAFPRLGETLQGLQ